MINRFATKLIRNKFVKLALFSGFASSYYLIINNEEIQSNCISALCIPELKRCHIESIIQYNPQLFFKIPEPQLTTEICEIFLDQRHEYCTTAFNDLPDKIKINVCFLKALVRKASRQSLWKTNLPLNVIAPQVLLSILDDTDLALDTKVFAVQILIRDQQINIINLNLESNSDSILNYVNNNNIFKGIPVSYIRHIYLVTSSFESSTQPPIGLLLTGSQFRKYFGDRSYIKENNYYLNLGLNIGNFSIKSELIYYPDFLTQVVSSHSNVDSDLKTIFIPDDALIQLNRYNIETNKILFE